MIEDEFVHWYKKESGETLRNTLRVETEDPTLNNGFPKDGSIAIKIANGQYSQFKLTPDEALRLGTLLLSIAKEQVNKKRVLWQNHDQ